MRVLGVDPGQRRVGLAASDDEGTIALPHRTLERGKDPSVFFAELKRAALELEIERVVIGLPLRLDGSEGEAARRARRFADAVEEKLGLPVELWDERLTTVAAERSLGEMGVSGKDRKAVVDQAAATLLLQSYLDAKTRRSQTKWDEDEIAAFNEAPQIDDARRGRGAGARGRAARRKRRRS